MVRPGFDPMNDAPVDAEEARHALRHERSSLTAANLVALFELYMRTGDTMIKAYEKALLAHVEAYAAAGAAR